MLGKITSAVKNYRLRKALVKSQRQLQKALSQNKVWSEKCAQLKHERDRAILLLSEQNELIALMSNHGAQKHHAYQFAANYSAQQTNQIVAMAADLASKNEQIAQLQKGAPNAAI